MSTPFFGFCTVFLSQKVPDYILWFIKTRPLYLVLVSSVRLQNTQTAYSIAFAAPLEEVFSPLFSAVCPTIPPISPASGCSSPVLSLPDSLPRCASPHARKRAKDRQMSKPVERFLPDKGNEALAPSAQTRYNLPWKAPEFVRFRACPENTDSCQDSFFSSGHPLIIRSRS